jgi:quercetin dioxygenase-like cupin family protein
MHMKINTPVTTREDTLSAKALSWLFAAAGSVLVCGVMALLSWPGAALATPPKDFKSDFTRSFFEKIRVLSRTDMDRDDRDDATVKIIAKEPSDVYVVINTVAPGGYSGWHTHPGPSVVLVKTGTATVYDGDDPTCTPVRYPAGTGFIDAGGGHVHMVRNEGKEQMVTEAFQIIPAGDGRRIEAPNPGYCPF